MLLNEIRNVGKERLETIEIDSVGLRSHYLVSEHNLTVGLVRVTIGFWIEFFSTDFLGFGSRIEEILDHRL